MRNTVSYNLTNFVIINYIKKTISVMLNTRVNEVEFPFMLKSWSNIF